MRRLLFLLLAIVGIGALSPAAPAAPAGAGHHRTMPGRCHDEGQAVAHVCVGCAVAPDAAAMPGRVGLAAARPAAVPPVPLADRRPGFDPPPPRAA